MTVRLLGQALAVNRVLFGIGFLVTPERSARTWIGSTARRGGARIFAQAVGARDLALGAGALAAMRNGRSARPWFAAHLASDATDLVATWRLRHDLPSASAAYALTVAGASTAIAAAYVVSGER